MAEGDTTLTPPSLKTITYSGSAIVANWIPAEGSGQYFRLSLFKDGTETQHVPAFGISGNLPSPAFDDTSVFTVAVAQTNADGSQVGSYSNAITVIIGPPQNVTVAYDGASFDLQWQAPAGMTVAEEGYVTLYNVTDSSTVEALSFPGTKATYTPKAALDPAKSYTITIAGESPGAYGPAAAALNVVQASVALAQLSYDGSQLLANASTPNPAYPTLGMYLFQDGKQIQYASGTGMLAHMTPDHSLRPWNNYTVALAWMDGNSRGPLSNSFPVMVETVIPQQVSYDGTHVWMDWENLPGTPQPTGAAMTVYDASGHGVAGASALGVSGQLTPDPGLTAGAAYTIAAQPSWGGSSGPGSTALPVITSKQEITSVAYNGHTVTVCWHNGDGPDVTHYQLWLYTGQQARSSEEVAGGQGVLDVILDPAGSYTVALQAMGNQSSGVVGVAVDVIAAVPTITGISYSRGSSSSSVVVDWNAAAIKDLPGITGYSLQLYENGQPGGDPVAVSHADTATGTITPVGVLAPWKEYSVTVQATGTNATGPLSEAMACIIDVPVITHTSIDGFSWSVAWEEISHPEVVGYEVQVTDSAGANAVTAYTTQPFYSAENQFTHNQFMVSVRALGAVAQGAFCDPVSLYGDTPSYYLSAPGSANPAYLYRSASHPPAAADITLYLPDIFTQEPSITSTVFNLTKPSGTPSGYPYLITITADSVAWKFDSASRTALWQAYITFLRDLDVMVGSGDDQTPLLKPGGFTMICQLLGRSLPLLFTEQLQYLYRFDATHATIDLVPGMRLRIQGGTYQYIGPPSPTSTNIPGFVAGGHSHADIGQYWQGGALNSGFDSYLSRCGRPQIPSVTDAGGAAGIMDFYPASNRQPLYRLLYPAQLAATNSTGHADLTDNLVVIGAGNFADLEDATSQYVQNGNFDGYSDKVTTTWFRGRTALVPEIPVMLDGQLHYVAVGTTLRDILALQGGGYYPAGHYLTGLTLERMVSNLMENTADAPNSYDALYSNGFRFSDVPLGQYQDGTDYRDLPLVQGDNLIIGA